ncbi:MAG: hypothetical protein ACTSQG_00915 [Promethearchaeota archaeon]
MEEKEYRWSLLLDWSNILKKLGFSSIQRIPNTKIEKAIKRLTRTYGSNTLLEKFAPSDLDELVIEELRELMKRELLNNQKMREQREKEMRSKVIPFKHGGIIKIDPRDFKDLDINANPDDIIKYLYKKFRGDKDDDGDDENNVKEDDTGYYI